MEPGSEVGATMQKRREEWAKNVAFISDDCF